MSTCSITIPVGINLDTHLVTSRTGVQWRTVPLFVILAGQRRRRPSGWSGQGRTTFQQVVGLISRLQRRSANEMVGPGVPRKLAFAQCVGVSRINRVLPADHAGVRRGLTGLHQHPRFAKYACVYMYNLRLLAIWRIPLLAVVPLLSLALRVGLMRRLPTSSCPFSFPKKPLTLFYIICTLPVVDLPSPTSLHMHESSFMYSGLTTFEMPAPPLQVYS